MGSANTLLQVTNPVIDSTTYIYLSAGQPVPLADFFLNFSYLSSADRVVNTTKSLKKPIESYERNDIKVHFSDFVFIVIIFLFSLLAYVRFYGKSYYRRIITSIFNYSYSTSFYKEKNLAFALNSNILLIVFYICAALLFVVAENHFKLVRSELNQFILLAINLTGLFVLLTLYKFVYRVCGMLFDKYRIVSEYLFYFNNLLKITGIIFLILLLGSNFTSTFWKNIFINLSILISIFLYFIKISRVLMILIKNRFSIYYLILYFCALEILPVILILKIIFLVNSGSNYAIF